MPRRASSSTPAARRWASTRAIGSFAAHSSRSSGSTYRVGSSDVVCGPIRYVTASMKVGPPPVRARSSAPRVAAMTASTSLPSTRMLGMPNPAARSASGRIACSDTGSEIANWLFWQKKTTGARKVAAKTIASFTSPWLVAPSPK